jgi:hypothetical protein
VTGTIDNERDERTYSAGECFTFVSKDSARPHPYLTQLSGLNGFGGIIEKPPLFVAAAMASVLIRSAHEIKDRLLAPNPVLAVLAIFCFSTWDLEAICEIVCRNVRGWPPPDLYFCVGRRTASNAADLCVMR